ncbi:MAG: cytochrome d ubiquinol oxidase subunit II [Chloroflexi bacterium HGW-Chloroflexi-8]|jgi:cytochrome d ubiquinol oxidase subunit II|nr:MAG: cytochrome d ubiquinol oxidase subunit II [Chloroflexi bacterium HGW-Chloroflexi-8]
MTLNTIWFLLIAVLFIGYFILEGFDFGVGILLPFVGKNDTERRMMINTIGPHWDGNEVWLITAGGAMFAAFPQWYATLFSGFYLVLFLMLIALIIRGVAFEFRSKDENPKWRTFWDWVIFIGSFIPAFLWGVALTNFIRGVPIDANFHFIGNFWNLISGYSLIGGLVSLTGFTLQGAIFLSLKLEEQFAIRINKIARKLWIPNIIAVFLFAIETYFLTDILDRLGVNPGFVPIAAVLSLLTVGWLVYQNYNGWAFFINCLAILFSTTTIFMILYPRVLVSSIDKNLSLTIINSASSPYTLKVMSIIALIFLPFVLGYQIWAYWVFRKRITSNKESLHY